MKKEKNHSLLPEFFKIQKASLATEDGQRCLVAPHPTLKKKIDAAMKKIILSTSTGVLSNRSRLVLMTD